MLEDIVKHLGIIKNPLVFLTLYIIAVCLLFNWAIDATYDHEIKVWIVGYVGLVMFIVLAVFSFITIRFPKNWYEFVEKKISEYDQTNKFLTSEGLTDVIKKTVVETLNKDK